MKNKNLILAIFILGIVLMSSIAFATTSTGYLIRKSFFGGEKRVPVVVEMPTQVAGIATGHTHLSDYIGEGIKTTGFIRNPNDPRNVYLTLTCPSGMVPIDGGFNLLFDSFNPQTQQLPTIQWDYHDLAAYYIAFYDAYDIINIEFSSAYIYCAKVEPTLHQFGQDY